METNKGKENNTILKIFLKVIEIVVIIICMFFVMIILTQRISNNDKAFLGFRLFKVETGSMIPKYLIGDVILVKEKNFNDIHEGDDISYISSSGKTRGYVITHRVVDTTRTDEKGEKVIITRGIANNTDDPQVYEEQVNGVVIKKLEILSFIVRGINNIYIFYFCIIIPLTVYIFFNLLKANRKEYER